MLYHSAEYLLLPWLPHISDMTKRGSPKKVWPEKDSFKRDDGFFNQISGGKISKYPYLKRDSFKIPHLSGIKITCGNHVLHVLCTIIS